MQNDEEVKLELVDMLEASNVHRWHIVPMARQQTLADHQWRVAMIVMYITRDCPHSFRSGAIWCALTHDLDEVLTGDIPAPVKKHVSFNLDINLPDWADRMDTPGRKEVVKMADLLESWLFCQENALRDKERYTATLIFGRVRCMRSTMPKEVAQRVDEVIAAAGQNLTKEYL